MCVMNNQLSSEKAKRNPAVDMAKYLASLGIVAIHTSLFADMNATLYFVCVQVLARFAVPFFAVCSGYYAARYVGNRKQISDHTDRQFWKQWTRIIILYAGWTILYLIYSIPGWPDIGWTVKEALLDYAHATIASGSHYHLWYLLSLVYAWPLFFLCRRFLSKKQMLILSVLLWLCEISSYAYPHLLPMRILQLFAVFDRVPALRDAVFRLLPLLLMGGLTWDGIWNPSRKTIVEGLTVCTILLIIEAAFLNSQGHQKLSYLLMTYPSAFFSFLLVHGFKMKQERRFGTFGAVSTIVYCAHPMFSDYLINRNVNSVFAFLVTVAASTAFALLWCLVKRKWLFRRSV